MGKMEKISRQNTRKTKMQRAILSYVISGGRVGGDMLIRHVVDSMLGTDTSTTSPRRNEIVKSVASRLNKKGLLKFEHGHYSATSLGERIFSEWEKSNYKIKIPKKWDKKWRVIIFDIPENKKRVREQVRHILSSAGFIRLQDSVWVFPYDCEDVIGLMKTDLGIGKHLLYMIVDQIENDRFLRMDFGLVQ
jgi:hypothetical protein